MAVPTTELDVTTLAAEVERRMAQVIAGNAPEDATVLRAHSAVEGFVRRELTVMERGVRRHDEMRRHGLRGRGSAEELAVWAGGGSENPCDSCIDRHGEERTMREWNVLGIPGSPNLECGRYCQCDLVPSGWVGGEEDEE